MKRWSGAAALIMVLLLIPGIDGARAQSARDINTEGYRLYEAGKYPEALEKFRRAVSADPGYALARYNLACTLGVLRKQGGEAICIYDAYKSAILDQLEVAVSLDPKTIDKIGADPDLDTVRDTVRYSYLLGLSPVRNEDIGAILVTVSWFGPAPGAFGPTATMDFREDASVILRLLDTTGDSPAWSEYSGTFAITANRITITLDRPIDGVTRFEGALLPGGSLDVPGLPGPFTDDPHDCEA